MYPIGTLKVTWINKEDFTILRSQMFKKENIDQAVDFGKKMSGGKDFMIFQLTETPSKDAYVWKLLPFGDSKRFINTMQNSESIIFKGFILLGVGLAIYGLLTFFKE